MSETSNMRILLTNDDGIHAPGLASLERIARALSDDVWIIAPETDQSGTSHSVTLHQPVRLREVREQVYALSGTPTDCVAMALKHMLRDHKPDLVLSGVNNGQNLADDMTYSGTIAGAMEGTVLGVKSIALSLARGFRGKSDMRWDTAEHFAPGVIRALLAQSWPQEILWNVNFPDAEIADVDRFEITRQGTRDVNNLFVDARTDTRGYDYFWFGFDRQLSDPAQGTDLRAIYEGRISATPLHLDLTQFELVAEISKKLDGPPPK